VLVGTIRGAELSRKCNENDVTGGIPEIDEVFHKAFVKLDEHGTEAAAATAAMTMSGIGGTMPAPRPKELRENHPFLFFLRHVRSGLVLFTGRVINPGAM